MNNNTFIEFRKTRELGEILSDTFSFIRSEFKPFLKTFFKIVGPYLLVMLLSFAFYLYTIGDVFTIGITSDLDAGLNIGLIAICLIMLMVSGIAVYALSQGTILYYIQSYSLNNGVANYEEIKRDVYKNFWNFVGLGFLVGISLVVGFLICFFPGVYLYVPLSLAFSVMVYNKMSVIDAYNYTFTLIKDEWWITFATLLVILIIVTVANYAFQVPATVYTWFKMGVLSAEYDIEDAWNVYSDPIYILLNLVSLVGQFVLNCISIVASIFIYFNLNEKKNFTGTFDRISKLGENLDNQ